MANSGALSDQQPHTDYFEIPPAGTHPIMDNLDAKYNNSIDLNYTGYSNYNVVEPGDPYQDVFAI